MQPLMEEVASNGLFDNELKLLYSEFKEHIFELSQLSYKLDVELEATIDFVTYEQIFNTVIFTYFHLICLEFDSKYFGVNEFEIKKYKKSIRLFSMLQERKRSFIQLMAQGQIYIEIKNDELRNIRVAVQIEEINFVSLVEFVLNIEIVKYCFTFIN